MSETSLSQNRRRIGRLTLLILGVVLVFLTLLNVGTGEATISPQEVLQSLWRHTPLLSHSAPALPEGSFLDSIVWEQRLPRALGGVMVGALLALAGVAFQSFLQNPLADPYMVGVSAGAALGSVVVILMGGTALFFGFAQPLAAFGTGLAATFTVYALARKEGRLSAQTFLLAGIVVGTFLWSFIPLILSLGSRSGSVDRQSAILSQLLGSLQALHWGHVLMLAVFGVIGTAMLWGGVQELNLMALGEESAAHLGVPIEAFKRRVIFAGSLVTAAAVSVAGIVAFVGLVVPHIARRIVGPDHRILLPTSLLLGGVVLVLADWMSRVWLAQLEIGVITSLMGAPVFCYLLRRRLTARN
jgi:iron complex transport system permease protein